jgi:chondroitin sulfate synthase
MSKAFMMLKYMYDNYLEKFEWFVRADDDVYMRMDELVAWLRSINSSYPQYIGQAGIGEMQYQLILGYSDTWGV